MTEEEYNYSVATGELQLSWGNKFSYYLFPLLMFAIAAIIVIIGILTGSNDIVFSALMMIVVIILGIFSFYSLKAQLKFKNVTSSLKRSDLIKKIESIIGEWGMETSFNDNQIYIAKTIPAFGKVYEQIIILFEGSSVFVCSVCDFDNGSFSVMSMWRNKKYVNAIIDEIEKVNP